MAEFDGVYWFSMADACKYLSVSRKTLYNYMREGKLPFYYIADTKTRRIKKEDIDRLMIRGNPEDDENE